MSDKKTTPTSSTADHGTAASRTTMSTPVPGTGASGGKSAGQMVDETKRAVADEASDLAGKAKAQASGLMDKAHDMADDKFDEVKRTATDKMEQTADQIRAAGHEFGDGSYQARAADYLASNLTRAADMVRTRDISTLASDVTRFARQNPAMFLGGAALLGFAAARLMKASERGVSGRGYDDGYGYAREGRFDAPPAGTYGTPYDRTATASGMSSMSSGGMGGGTSSGMGTGTGTGMGSGSATGSGMGGSTSTGGLGTTPGMGGSDKGSTV